MTKELQDKDFNLPDFFSKNPLLEIETAWMNLKNKLINNKFDKIMKPTQEQLDKWYCHKSNKEQWIEDQEKLEEELEDESELDAMGDEYGA